MSKLILASKRNFGIKVFEGEDGVSFLRKEMDKTGRKTDSCEVFNYDQINHDQEDIDYRRKVSKMEGSAVCLCSSKTQDEGSSIVEGSIFYNIKKMPDDEIFLGELIVREDNTVLISPGDDNYKDVKGVIIKDRKIAQTVRLLIKKSLEK